MNDKPDPLLDRLRKDSRERRAWTAAYFLGAILVALVLIAIIGWLYQ